MKQEGLNNVEMGRAIGVSHVSIGNFLSGQLPKAEHLHALATHFDVSMDWLLTGKAGPSRLDNGGEEMRAQESYKVYQPGHREPCPECAVNLARAKRAEQRAAETAKKLEILKRVLEQ